MGSFLKTVSVAAAATLTGAILAASPALARGGKPLACSANLVSEVSGASNGAILRLARNCTYKIVNALTPAGGASVTLVGGPGTVILQTAVNTRVANISAGQGITFQRIFIQGGNVAGGNGGGIQNTGGTLKLDQVTLSGNEASGGGKGGAIYNTGTATINHTLIIGNAAIGGFAGGEGGGIYNDGILNLFESDITGNYADLDGGGVYTDNSATSNIKRTTIQGNRAADPVGGGGGGGVYNVGRTKLTLVLVQYNSAKPNGTGGVLNVTVPANLTTDRSIIRYNSPTNCMGFSATDCKQS